MAILDIDRPKKASFIKVRFLIVIMATLCPVVCYISRQNLSLAIVAMVKDSALESTNTGSNVSAHGHKFDTCPEPEIEPGIKVKNTSYGPKYDWKPFDISLIFQAFFGTYVLCQIPGARYAEVIGAKWILFTATLGSSLISLFSPWAASIHVYVFVLLRTIMGVCQTALYPACYVLYTQWLPPTERSQALPILGAGAFIGSIIASTATGLFSEEEAWGWEYAFYMPALLCAIWSVVWIFIGASEPRQHKFISVEEIEYIESKMEIKKALDTIKKSPSWKKILTSQHIWAMMAAFIASNWAFSIIMLLLPSYLNYILRIPPFKNGLINSMIYILFCISSPIVGAVSTLMIETRAFGLNRLHTRKLFQSIAVFSQAICFVIIPMIGCDTNAVLGVLYTQIVLFSFVNGGEVQLPSDLSLDFAGTIYAIGNCIGSSTGVIVPLIRSLIITHPHDKGEWNTYFYVAAIVTSIGGLIFLIFGKNDLQDFSKDPVESQVNIYLATEKTSPQKRSEQLTI